MIAPEWLEADDAFALHEEQIRRYGGSAGLRDEGLLLSGIARAQNLFAYGSPTLCELAAAYAAGVIRNHPFIDGNKRTGLAMALLFLELNGFRLSASQADTTRATLALAAGETTEEQFATWLADNVRPF